MDNLLKNIIDMHIHSAPDIRKRSHTDLELIKTAIKFKAEALVLKSHQFPTVDRAWYLQKLYPEVQVFGSITCNNAIGGLNLEAISYAIELGAKVIWLPTIDAENHKKKQGAQGGIRLTKGEKLRTEVIQIIELAAKADIVVGTGHVSYQEIMLLCEEAYRKGFEKLVITHPEFHIVNIPVHEQQSLRKKYNVFFERTFAQPIGGGEYKMNLDTNLQAITEVGFESTIISTDSGQIENPPWEEALNVYLKHLIENGVSYKQVKYMSNLLPKKLLNLSN